jgi:dodecin
MAMAKKQKPAAAADETGVYRVIEVIGASPDSWEDAARRAIQMAAGSLRDLRIAEVTMNDVKIEQGKIVAYRTKLSLSFKYEP